MITSVISMTSVVSSTPLLFDVKSVKRTISLNTPSIYLFIELFIVINTIHHVFLQDPSETNIGYWFRKQWVVLPDYMTHYKRNILLIHFFAGMLSLFGMRYQTSGSHQTNPTTHRYLGYLVLIGQILVRSPTILMMNAFVQDYALSRKVFYMMTFTATMKCSILTMKYAIKKDIPKHRRAALTIYNYISTFTKGRIYMYAALPMVPNAWKPFHIFISDVVSVALAQRYSWPKMFRLSLIFFIFGQMIEFTPFLWHMWAVAGVLYTAIYA